MWDGKYAFEKSKIIQGDCLEKMKLIPDGSVQLICSDLPYYKKVNKEWDKQWRTKNDFLKWVDALVKENIRVMKPNGKIVFFAPQEFSHNIATVLEDNGLLIETNGTWIKSDGLGAEKGLKAGNTTKAIAKSERYIIAKHPNPLGDVLKCEMLKNGDSALSLCRKLFNKSTGIVSLWLAPRESWGSCLPKCRDWVNAMNLYGCGVTDDDYYELRSVFNIGYLDYDCIEFNHRIREKLHQTQKPLGLIELFIQAHTNNGDLVLDNTSGSGTLAEACINTNRDFIIIEKNPIDFEKGKKRVGKIFKNYGLDLQPLLDERM